MYFSIIAIILVAICGIFLYRKYSWKTYIGYLEPFEASSDSYKKGEYSKSKYFYYSEGVINLKKHPELQRFHVIGGKDVLVKPWDRQENLLIDEGKTKVAIFEVIDDLNGIYIGIPCIRVVESIIVDETNDPLSEYKKTSLGVSWGNGEYHKVLPGENLIGTIEYESL